MKTLADFKRKLQAALTTGTLVKVTRHIQGQDPEVKPPVPVKQVQTDRFALDRAGRNSYEVFGKASFWQFSHDTAIRLREGVRLYYTFVEPLPTNEGERRPLVIRVKGCLSANYAHFDLSLYVENRPQSASKPTCFTP